MVAKSDPDSIKITHEVDGGVDEYVLAIDGGRRATLVHKDGRVALNFDIAGDFLWAEAKVFIQGLVKLAEVGDELAGNKTDVERLLHKPTEEEKEMAKAKANARQKKADKKAGKAAGPRESAAQMFQDLIMAGNLTDDKIFEKVQAKFGLSDDKRSYVAWYRNKLKKDGKKPPAAKE